MERRLLEYYNRELRHLREMGDEFNNDCPEAAELLDLKPGGSKCRDPYVERLLEGFAFLAARVQFKIDAEFPRFTEHLLEFVYPHYLAPTPSMAVVRLQPDNCPPEGFPVPRDTPLRVPSAKLPKDEQTRCEYLTAHAVKLFPLEIADAEYLSGRGAIPEAAHAALRRPDAAHLPEVKAAIRLRLRALGGLGLALNQIGVDGLPLYLCGDSSLSGLLYEQLLANAVAVAGPGRAGAATLSVQKPRPLGFEDHEALLPTGPRSFQGYRLLQEYAAFPERFLFVELAGLGQILQECGQAEADILVLLDRAQPKLANALDKSQFALFCTPAINLFPRQADRILLTQTQPEYPVIPDRLRAADFEVHSVVEVKGYEARQGDGQVFQPFYSAASGYRQHGQGAYYTLRRQKRLPSSKQLKNGPRTRYLASEAFIALVDVQEAPYRSGLKELGLKLLCTNCDLPHSMRAPPAGFSLDIHAPAEEAVRCVSGPTDPKPSAAVGGVAWRLLSHLSLNYLSLTGHEQGAAALHELLGLYSDAGDERAQRRIKGLLSVQSANVTRRLAAAGPIVFGRGLEIALRCDESAFEGSGAFLLGAVLERFFARYVSLNTFTETVLSTVERGEIMRWPPRTGSRPRL